jgi:predicted DNA-binding protein
MSDSEEIHQRRNENLADYKIRRLEKLVESYEKRIRELEDYKLAAKVTHRNMVTWITIASTAFAAAVSLLEHIIFK